MTETIRKGGWRSTQRSKLSASRGPHKSNPKDFYYDAETAPERLAHRVSGAGEIPEELTRETELERLRLLRGYEGISWMGASGRNFTKEYWNPLIGLWADTKGLDFVFDLMLEGIDDPDTSPFMDRMDIPSWIGLRRYLFAATPKEYAAARERMEPIFEELYSRCYEGDGPFEVHVQCDGIAFAFSRGSSEWADRCLKVALDNKQIFNRHAGALMSATLDPQLALRAATQYTNPMGLYFVFDIVESLGADAIPVLDFFEPRMAPEKKRLAQAKAIAEKVAAL